jgi:hypothetical protein
LDRTVPAYRNILENLVNEWQGFKKALRKEDREAVARLMAKARLHSDAAGYDVRTSPAESVFMSILLEQERERERERDWRIKKENR